MLTTGFLVTVVLNRVRGAGIGFVLGLIVGLSPLLGVGFTGLTLGFKVGLVFRTGFRVGLGLIVGLMILGLPVGLVLGLSVGFITGTLGRGFTGLAGLGLVVDLTAGFRGGGFFTKGFLVGLTAGLVVGVGLVGLLGFEVVLFGIEVV